MVGDKPEQYLLPACCALTMTGGAKHRRTCVSWPPARPISAPASASWRSMRSPRRELCHAGGGPHPAPPADGDGVAAPLQHARPRGADLPAYRRSPPPFFPAIQASPREVVPAAPQTPVAPPLAGADPAPRWTLRRLVGWVEATFGRTCCRETIRRALHRLKLSWKKARKLLGRADPQRREAFLAQVQDLLADAQQDRHLLVYLDEAHIHRDADPGYGWSARGQRFWGASHAPRLADKLSFYGLYLYNEGEVRLWPYARANGEDTIEVLQRLRAEWP